MSQGAVDTVTSQSGPVVSSSPPTTNSTPASGVDCTLLISDATMQPWAPESNYNPEFTSDETIACLSLFNQASNNEVFGRDGGVLPGYHIVAWSLYQHGLVTQKCSSFRHPLRIRNKLDSFKASFKKCLLKMFETGMENLIDANGNIIESKVLGHDLAKKNIHFKYCWRVDNWRAQVVLEGSTTSANASLDQEATAECRTDAQAAAAAAIQAARRQRADDDDSRNGIRRSINKLISTIAARGQPAQPPTASSQVSNVVVTVATNTTSPDIQIDVISSRQLRCPCSTWSAAQVAEWSVEVLNFPVEVAYTVRDAGIDGRTLGNMREGDLKDAEQLLNCVLPNLTPLQRFNFIAALKTFQGTSDARVTEVWGTTPSEIM